MTKKKKKGEGGVLWFNKVWEPLVTGTNLCTLFITLTPAQGAIILGRRKRGGQREKHKLLSRSN